VAGANFYTNYSSTNGSAYQQAFPNNSVARSVLWPDKGGTIAFLDDITGTSRFGVEDATASQHRSFNAGQYVFNISAQLPSSSTSDGQMVIDPIGITYLKARNQLFLDTKIAGSSIVIGGDSTADVRIMPIKTGIGNPAKIVTVDGDGFLATLLNTLPKQNSITTNASTLATIATIDCSTNLTAHTVEFTVSAFNETLIEVSAAKYVAVFKNVAGVLTGFLSSPIANTGDLSTWNYTISLGVSGTNGLIQVTPSNANNTIWTVQYSPPIKATYVP
jgi:hypothetical protein